MLPITASALRNRKPRSIKPILCLSVRQRKSLSFLYISCFLALSIVFTALKPKPVLGAERILISYGPLEFALPVSSLEKFAKTGCVHRRGGSS